ADYVAPAGAGDHIGAFAVGVFGADELAAREEADNDDYREILTTARDARLPARRARREVRGRQRRLPGDPDQGARRPARRGVCRVLARGEPQGLVRAGPAELERGADRRALPRHTRPLRVTRGA